MLTIIFPTNILIITNLVIFKNDKVFNDGIAVLKVLDELRLKDNKKHQSKQQKENEAN